VPHYRSQLEASLKSTLHEAKGRLPAVKVDWPSTESTTNGFTPATADEILDADASVDAIADPVIPDTRSRYNSSKVALLIEPRPLPHLIPQMLHMISVVPSDWRFVFIGSSQSVVSVGRSPAMKLQQETGKLDIMTLPEPWEIDSKEKVHRLLTDIRFYDEFLPGVESILKYEFDSILCANSEKSLNEWLHWDWAGAARFVAPTVMKAGIR
jgi:hypothetical protein